MRFLARNRLIAAMSRGTIVVEAALRSGARNTAGWALGCGRPPDGGSGPGLFPGRRPLPHLMIRNGQAVLVTSAAEVLELISDMGQAMLPLAQGRASATDALTETQLAVFEAIPARRRAPVGRHRPGRRTSAFQPALAALTALESAGLVEGDERGWLVALGGSRCVIRAHAPSGSMRAFVQGTFRSSGPAVDEPDLPSLTKTATARSPCAAIIQAWVLSGFDAAVLSRAGLGQHCRSPEDCRAPAHCRRSRPRIMLRSWRSLLTESEAFPSRWPVGHRRRCGITVSPAATDATTAAIAIGEASTLPWPIIAAARPVAVGSSGTEPKKDGKPTS